MIGNKKRELHYSSAKSLMCTNEIIWGNCNFYSVELRLKLLLYAEKTISATSINASKSNLKPPAAPLYPTAILRL